MKNKLIIGCKVLKNEIENILEVHKLEYKCIFLDEQLHNTPEILREQIQNEIDSNMNVDEFLIAYGNCGNALVGIKAVNGIIRMMKADDCIHMLLNESPFYCEKKRTSYFGSVGWLLGKEDLGFEYDRMKIKYGEKRALRITKSMFENYKYLSFIKTNSSNEAEGIVRSRIKSKKLGLCFELIEGDLKILEDLLMGHSSDKLISVKRGEMIKSQYFK